MDPLLLTILLLSVLCLILAVGWRLSTGALGRANRSRQRHAQRGERRAERLLRSQGFKVVDRQVAGSWSFSVDGESRQASVRVDLLVQRGGETFVAEVKTGQLVTDACFPATRRQLLEYALVFRPYGVLLVDVDAGSVEEIRFPGVS